MRLLTGPNNKGLIPWAYALELWVIAQLVKAGVTP